MFLIIPETNINTFYIINIIRIKRNFKFIIGRAAAVKIIIIIKIITTITAAVIIIKFILFIIKKSIIRY